MTTVNGVLVAIPPPPGYLVDFDNPQRRSVMSTYIVSGIGLAVSTFFMAQKLYVKGVLRNTFGLDDVFLIFAWLGSVAIQGLIIYAFYHSIIGVHGWEISFELFKDFALFGGYLNSIIYTVPTTFSKLAILLFYREINNPQDWYRWAVYCMMFIVTISGVGIFFSSVFPCHPVIKSYDIMFPPDKGWCIDRPAMYQATAAIGVATDILIFSIPVPMVISLKMTRMRKAGLIGMFAVGSATVVTSMVRLALLINVLDDVDQTWGGGPVSLWICVEANLLIMCASLSTLNHFVKAVAPKLLSSVQNSSHKKSSSKAMSSNHELRTFGAGSSRNRAYYNRFDETDIGTDTVIDVQGLPPKAKSRDNSRTSGEDNESDKGIIQTRETHVYYEYP